MKELKRRYGKWAGNEKGKAENPINCVYEIFSARNCIGYQCHRKRGYGPDGLYCKQHATKIQGYSDTVFLGDKNDQ